jgi:tRNA A37 threonylcarbamoyladenosine biosynthesis protein TsaE
LDLYRLDHPDQVLAAGLSAYFLPVDGVTLVEWFDKIRDQIKVPSALRVITFTVQSESERVIGYEDPRT